MNPLEIIPDALIKDATNLWLVENPNHPDAFGVHMFRSLDDATQWVASNVATRLPYQVDLKDDGSDDEMSPKGAVTALRWSCPKRPMTREECLATGSRYAKDWVKSGNHPNTEDWDAAARQQVSFVGEKTEHVYITRVSRHLGYLKRSGYLNDKTKDVNHLLMAWEGLLS